MIPSFEVEGRDVAPLPPIFGVVAAEGPDDAGPRVVVAAPLGVGPLPSASIPLDKMLPIEACLALAFVLLSSNTLSYMTVVHSDFGLSGPGT